MTCLGPFLLSPVPLSPMHPVAHSLEPKNSIKGSVSKRNKERKKILTIEAQTMCLGLFLSSPASPSPTLPVDLVVHILNSRYTIKKLSSKKKNK